MIYHYNKMSDYNSFAVIQASWPGVPVLEDIIILVVFNAIFVSHFELWYLLNTWIY